MCRKCSENCLKCTSYSICTECKQDTRWIKFSDDAWINCSVRATFSLSAAENTYSPCVYTLSGFITIRKADNSFNCIQNIMRYHFPLQRKIDSVFYFCYIVIENQKHLWQIQHIVGLEVSGIQCSLTQFTKCSWWCAVGWKTEPAVQRQWVIFTVSHDWLWVFVSQCHMLPLLSPVCRGIGASVAVQGDSTTISRKVHASPVTRPVLPVQVRAGGWWSHELHGNVCKCY